MKFKIFNKFLKFNPHNPSWFNRDRFVLSAGHGSMLLYSALYLSGYKTITIEDIKNFPNSARFRIKSESALNQNEIKLITSFLKEKKKAKE